MGKLNQVVAVVEPKKKLAAEALTEAYHKIQKPDLFSGISKTYTPKDEEGDKFPSESRNVQVKYADLIESVFQPLRDMFDATATQDYNNCSATASIVVDDQVLLKDVPVTYLLFIDKQIENLKTFVSKLPTLDPAENWHYDENADCYASTPGFTTKTKKVPVRFVKYDATPEHPAQVDVLYEDIVTGTWKTIKYSGAIPVQQKNELLARVRKLKEAVIKAREEANQKNVDPVYIGETILNYALFMK